RSMRSAKPVWLIHSIAQKQFHLSMSRKTQTAPEAELEARITGTLKRIFPGGTELRAQRRFKLRLGHTVFEGGTRDYVEGRADILVYQGEDPLAVLELKREGLTLVEDDILQ